MSNTFVYDFDQAKSYEALCTENKIFSGTCIRPDNVQSISRIRQFIKSVASKKHKQATLGSSESIILLGFDSIKYGFAKQTLNPDLMVPLTSVFPSTSVCAWTWALTGQPPEISRIIAPAFYAKEIGDMYVTLDDTYGHNGNWKSDKEGARRFPVLELDNFFTDINKLGFETVCINGVYAYTFSRWSQALLKDAGRVEQSKSDWNKIFTSPAQIAQSIIEDVNNAISTRDTKKPLFVWSLIDFDSYIHVHGYSHELARALNVLSDFFQDLAQKGHLVITFADHGQTQQKYSPLTEEWHKIIGTNHCRNQAGGAGRARWAYPTPKNETFVFEKTKEILGDNALVLHRDDLSRHSILSVGPNLRLQVGEIIALALTDNFPLAVYGDGFTHEHGALSADEMCVPLMAWKPS